MNSNISREIHRKTGQCHGTQGSPIKKPHPMEGDAVLLNFNRLQSFTVVNKFELFADAFVETIAVDFRSAFSALYQAM